MKVNVKNLKSKNQFLFHNKLQKIFENAKELNLPLYEFEFIRNIVVKWKGRELSYKQAAYASKLIEKYFDSQKLDFYK